MRAQQNGRVTSNVKNVALIHKFVASNRDFVVRFWLLLRTFRYNYTLVRQFDDNAVRDRKTFAIVASTALGARLKYCHCVQNNERNLTAGTIPLPNLANEKCHTPMGAYMQLGARCVALNLRVIYLTTCKLARSL
jgi:hypothetical protein